MKMLILSILLVVGAVTASDTPWRPPARAKRTKPLRSVLMLAVDDLRPQLSIYPEGGGSYMHTPNMERLAKQSVVFERAYVQVALCMPSRTSLLTSRRPDTSRSWTIEADQWFRLSSGNSNWTTLPGAFKQAGYFTMGMGKVFHETMPAKDPQDATVSWSKESLYPRGKGVMGLYDPRGEGGRLGGGGHLAYGFDDADEGKLQDGNLTDHAVATIQKMAAGGYGADVASGKRPFFLAVGLHKPHVPWWVPERFFDLYPLNEIPPVPHPNIPYGAANASMVPYAAFQDWQVRSWCSGSKDMAPYCGRNASQGDNHPLSARYPLDNTTVSPEGAAHMRQAYFASVSFTDYNIGRILDAFEAAPILSKNTVICFWGDHGWHLGDNDQWAKMTNFEHATKIPLMISCGGDQCTGRSSAIVEAIDIMPTLLEEAGLPIERCPETAAASRQTDLCTEGKSLSSLLRAPEEYNRTSMVALSQFPRPEHPNSMLDDFCRDAGLHTRCPNGPCLGPGKCPNKMGYTIRADLGELGSYRYTKWLSFNKCSNSSCPELLANWDLNFGVELYNHSDSPVPQSYDIETTNIAGLASSIEVQSLLDAELKRLNTRATLSEQDN